jgi:hypothetical protein
LPLNPAEVSGSFGDNSKEHFDEINQISGIVSNPDQTPFMGINENVFYEGNENCEIAKRLRLVN